MSTINQQHNSNISLVNQHHSIIENENNSSSIADGYFPCFHLQIDWIRCESISLGEIAQMFASKNRMNISAKTIEIFHLVLPPTETPRGGPTIIPPNLLQDHQVTGEILIECLTAQNLSIDAEAFRSSRNFTLDLKISACDLSRLEFHFLKDFQQLRILTFYSDTNVHLAEWSTLPILHDLNEFKIIYCTGLNEMSQFPRLFHGMMKIDLSSSNIGDSAIDRILEWMQNLYGKLSHLNLESNALTKIPAKITSFNQIRKIFLGHNLLSNATIPSGSFFGSDIGLTLHLENMGIESIHSGAFQGVLHNFSTKYFSVLYCTYIV